MKLLLHVCATSSANDRETNQVSLFNVVEEMHVPSFPIVIPSLTIVSLLKREKGDRTKQNLQVRFTLGRKVIADLPFEVDFQKGPRCRHNAEVRGLMIPSPGILKIGLRYKDKPMGSAWPIDVIDTGKATIEQPKGPPTAPTTRKTKKKSPGKRPPSTRSASKTNKAKTSKPSDKK